MKVTAMQNGPYLIKVSKAILKKGDKEEKLDGNMVHLCRCGHSANKPFCDGAHKNAGFEADAVEVKFN